jgi:hypothetical protein
MQRAAGGSSSKTAAELCSYTCGLYMPALFEHQHGLCAPATASEQLVTTNVHKTMHPGVI